MLSRGLRVAALIAVAVIALAAGTAIALLRGDAIYPGVRVDGVDLGGLSIERAESRLGLRAADATREPLALRYAGENFRTTIGDIGGRMDARSCAQAAYSIGRRGNLLRRIGDVIAARRGRVRVAIFYAFDMDWAAARLRRVARNIERQPIDARLVVEEGGCIRAIREKPGIKIHLEKSLSRIVQTVNSGGREVDLVIAAAEPKVRVADFKGIDGVIASYSTPYKLWQRDRTHNLRIACRAINGTLIKPGEVFSYNESVGPRLKKYGFRTAPIFVHGEVEPGTGGGVCQVSTTVYNAALLANMKILKRSHHSRPVVYAPVGRDATVAYPYPDLKFENTSEAPVYITAWAARGNVNICALGKKVEGRKIEIITVGHRVIGFPTVEAVEEGLEPGERIVRRGGRAGHSISVYRIIKSGGGIVKRELISRDYYRPESRVVAVSAAPPI